MEDPQTSVPLCTKAKGNENKATQDDGQFPRTLAKGVRRSWSSLEEAVKNAQKLGTLSPCSLTPQIPFTLSERDYSHDRVSW